MTCKASSTTAALFVLLLAGAGGLAGCATPAAAPQPKAGPAAPTAAPTRGYGEMAPVPNPTDEETVQPKAANPQPRRSAPAGAARPSPKPVVPALPTGPNPQRAAQLRASGLEQLNRGAIDRAVDLLQQAQRLDPANALIQRDLERAQRISRAVKAN